MKEGTIAFPIRNGRVLLGIKNQKIGAGKWNGPGGHIENGETPEQATTREIFEESGLKTIVWDLEKRALIDFYKDNILIFKVHIFVVTGWNGDPKDTKEMCKFTWFPFDEIPVDNMLAGDVVWLKMILMGKKVKGSVYYDGAMNLLHHEIAEVNLLD